ncbi:lysine--tRNA ligase [Streptomyces sp. CBMA123]|uniref:lysine--tRNA ligase n=1 Tax=Streptomyces sp. CBMA123 TaxID=1896313 RepID=UPI001661A9A0|nr:lysine--tRNA ligase [Streptomyces sp. CBMA123]
MVVKQSDWVAAAADQVIAEGKRRGGAPLVCASGVSPSGPIHLGNLREIMVPHFVADEIRRRGLECRHLLSWDDYDRLRKVPAGVPASFSEHIGRPLTAVPDPCGEHENWAEHFKVPLRSALAQLGVEVDEISQTQMYTSGAYREQIVHAMRHRQQIDGVLGRYRTKKVEVEVEQDEEDLASASAGGYYPYRPYCEVCERDSTVVISFDEASTQMRYRCDCSHEGGFALSETDSGKLVWKVDWPMRWAFEGVTFEAGGVDHSSPGSSFTVGSQLVREVFDGFPPSYLGYSFVGISGMAKMSSSKGGVPTPIDILEVLEPAVLRWLYNRRQPRQSFQITLDQEILRLYDEWDALGRKAAVGTATDLEVAVRARSIGPAAGPLPATPKPLPFRTLASVADVAAGDPEQTLRILQDFTVEEPLASLDEAQPRPDGNSNRLHGSEISLARWPVRPAAWCHADHHLAEAELQRHSGPPQLGRTACPYQGAGRGSAWRRGRSAAERGERVHLRFRRRSTRARWAAIRESRQQLHRPVRRRLLPAGSSDQPGATSSCASAPRSLDRGG